MGENCTLTLCLLVSLILATVNALPTQPVAANLISSSSHGSSDPKPPTPDGLYVHVPREQELIPEDTPAPVPRAICTATNSSDPSNQPWTCSNWAGTVKWAPSGIVSPEDEEELAAYLRAAASNPNRPTMKVVGFAHSWADLYIPAKGSDGTPGVTVALHKLSGITRRVSPAHVEVLAGTSFATLFSELAEMGLALAWSPGGIQGLTVGGAVAVGFHGSQMSVGGVSSVVQALRLYDTEGNPHDLSDYTTPEAMKAARMGLGMCGIVTRVTLPVVPQFHLRRRRWRVDVGSFLGGQLPTLKATYDRFHWYIHPFSSSAWPMYWEPATPEESLSEGRPCRTALEQFEDAEEKEFGVDGLPLIMRWDNCSDVSYRSLTHAVDMEKQPLWNGEYYVALDDEGEVAATKEILERFQQVAVSRGQSKPSPNLWLHVRYVGGDTSSLLNPCYGTAVCAAFELALVAPSMEAPLPPWDEWAAYFEAMEDVLSQLGGRPHHAKYWSANHRPAQPAFGLSVDEFRRECRAFDPQRLLRNDAFDAVFGMPPAASK